MLTCQHHHFLELQACIPAYWSVTISSWQQHCQHDDDIPSCNINQIQRIINLHCSQWLYIHRRSHHFLHHPSSILFHKITIT